MNSRNRNLFLLERHIAALERQSVSWAMGTPEGKKSAERLKFQIATLKEELARESQR